MSHPPSPGQDQSQPYYQQPYYQQPVPGPYGPGMVAPTSGRATTSLVLGIVSLVMCGLLLGIPAMIVARQAKREIRESQGRLGGEGLATAGFWTGLVGTVWSVLLVAFIVAVLALGSTVRSDFESRCTSVTNPDGSTSVDCG